MLATLIYCSLAIAILMLLVWAISLKLSDVSIVDIVWGLGFVIVAWVAYFCADQANQTNEPTFGRMNLPLLVTIWGLRLSGYLFWRNHGKPEDYRYREMREKWGSNFWWVSLFTVFVLQGVLMWIVSLPVQVGVSSHNPNLQQNFQWLLWIGVVLWAIGFAFESIGDWQLARFKANPANQGRVLDSGLWRYTRHPNYFGNFLIWWGIYLVSMSLHPTWWTILSPIVMSILLMKISGVALLEKSLSNTKPEYASYTNRTNAFFPWLPKQ